MFLESTGYHVMKLAMQIKFPAIMMDFDNRWADWAVIGVPERAPLGLELVHYDPENQFATVAVDGKELEIKGSNRTELEVLSMIDDKFAELDPETIGELL